MLPGNLPIARSERPVYIARRNRLRQPVLNRVSGHLPRRRSPMLTQSPRTRAVTRRRFAAGTSAGLGALVLAACGAPDGSIAPAAQNTKAFRLLWQVRGNVGDEALVTWGIAEFKKKYPNGT